MENKEEKRLWAIEQLQNKQREVGRTPQKADFDEVTRSRIKAFLGPWPRALEAAGLKAPRSPKPEDPARAKRRKKRNRHSEKNRPKPGGEQTET